MRWLDQDKKAVAELEVYRIGGEPDRSGSSPGIAARIDPAGGSGLEAAGVIDSKFGPVTLLRAVGGAPSCIGFAKHFTDPDLQISGWSCQGGAPRARRAAVACLLNRLVLLTAKNEPGLASLFASAELARGGCAAPSSRPADWVTAAENPALRGSL